MKNRIFIIITTLFLFMVMACEDGVNTLFQSPAKEVPKITENKINLQASMYQHANKIVLKWNFIENAHAYYIYKLNTPTATVGVNTPIFKIVNTKKNKKEYTEEVLVDADEAVTHYFIVYAMEADSSGESGTLIRMKSASGDFIESDMKVGKNLSKIKLIDNPSDAFHSITLRWDLVEGANSYYVKRKVFGTQAYINLVKIDINKDNDEIRIMEYSDDGKTLLPSVIQHGDIIEYVDMKVQAETKYSYVISSQNYDADVLIAENSREKDLTTLVQNAPFAVQNFKVEKYIKKDIIGLMWDVPQDLVGYDSSNIGYNIYRRVKSAVYTDLFVKIHSTEVGVITYTDLDVEIGEIYDYKIIAFYTDNNVLGMSSEIKEGVTIPQPKGVSAQLERDLDQNIQQVKLTWDPLVDSLETDLDANGLPPTLSVHIIRSFANIVILEKKVSGDELRAKTYVDTEDLSSGDYLYSVQLVNDNGEKGRASKEVLVKISQEQQFNFDFKASKHLENKIRFSWTQKDEWNIDSVELQKYNLEIKEYQPFQSAAHEVKSGDNAYTLTIESTDAYVALYRLKVTTSSVVSYTGAVIGTALQVPQEIQATRGESKTHITVSWKAVLGVSKYYLEAQYPGSITWLRQSTSDSGGNASDVIIPVESKDSAAADEQLPSEKSTLETMIKQIRDNEIVTKKRVEFSFVPHNNDLQNHRGEKINIRVQAIAEDQIETDLQVSGFSSIVEGNTFGPALLGVSVTKAEYNNKIVVSWNHVKKAERYEIVRKTMDTGDEFSLALVLADGSNTYTYEDTVETPSYENKLAAFPAMQLDTIFYKAYEYSVRPIRKNISLGLFSEAVSGYILGSPKYVDASYFETGKGIAIYWQQVPGAQKYKIYTSQTQDEASFSILAIVDNNDNRDADLTDVYEYTQRYNHTVGKNQIRYYKIVAERTLQGKTIVSKIPTQYAAKGATIDVVTNVQASDRAKAIGYNKSNVATAWNTKEMYIAKHGAVVPVVDGNTYVYKEYSKNDTINNPVFKVNPAKQQLFATKITWTEIPHVTKYYIYRLDFNEPTNFWRKIGERTQAESKTFFDTETLILREYRALYWIVAVVQDRHGKIQFDESLASIGNKRGIYNSSVNIPNKFNAQTIDTLVSRVSFQDNIAVGSRELTVQELTNWALHVVGIAVYKLGAHSYGPSNKDMNVETKGTWGFQEADLIIKNYSLSERGDPSLYTKEMIVDVSVYDCGFAGLYNCSAMVVEGRPDDIGASFTYIGSRGGRYASDDDGGYGKQIHFFSPYGKLVVSLIDAVTMNFGSKASSEAGKIWVDMPSVDGRSYATAYTNKYKITHRAVFGKNGVVFNTSSNSGTPSLRNPFITISSFNGGGDYDKVLKSTYGEVSARESSALE